MGLDTFTCPEPLPIPGDSPAVYDLVYADLQALYRRYGR